MLNKRLHIHLARRVKDTSMKNQQKRTGGKEEGQDEKTERREDKETGLSFFMTLRVVLVCRGHAPRGCGEENA